MNDQPNEAQICAGAHMLSELYNDNAPIGESRYRSAAEQVFKAMMEAKDKPVVPLCNL